MYILIAMRAVYVLLIRRDDIMEKYVVYLIISLFFIVALGMFFASGAF